MSVAMVNRLAGFSRFVGAGVISFALISIVMSGLIKMNVNTSLAYAIALAISFLFNFFCNRIFVFSARGAGLTRQAASYLVTSLAFRGGEWLAFTIVESQVKVAPMFLAFIVQGVSTCVKFMVYKHKVFRSIQPNS